MYFAHSVTIYGAKIARRAGLIKDRFVYTSLLNMRRISQAIIADTIAGMPINSKMRFISE